MISLYFKKHVKPPFFLLICTFAGYTFSSLNLLAEELLCPEAKEIHCDPLIDKAYICKANGWKGMKPLRAKKPTKVTDATQERVIQYGSSKHVEHTALSCKYDNGLILKATPNPSEKICGVNPRKNGFICP